MIISRFGPIRYDALLCLGIKIIKNLGYQLTGKKTEGHSINKGNFMKKSLRDPPLHWIPPPQNVNSVLFGIALGQNYSKMAVNQIMHQGLNRGLSSNFWWLRIVNPMKCTKECVMWMKKYLFSF